MDGGGRSTGFAIPLVLGLWIAGVAVALGNIDEQARTSGSAVPDPAPVSLPTAVQVGTAIDPDTGLVTNQTMNFGAESTIAFSVWLGSPYGAGTLLVNVARLESDGFRVVGHTEELPADAESPLLAAQIPADLLMDSFGPGTYLLDLKRPPSERIGYGVVQLETESPEAIDLFVEGWRAVAISAGEHTAYRFGADGETTAELSASIARDAALWSNHRATFAGRAYLFVLEGPWENHYLPESAAVRLADVPGSPAAP